MKRALELTSLIRNNCFPITEKGAQGTHCYGPLLEAIGDAEIVMIGEASHGTQEFYKQRAEITKLLITEKGFTFVAAEADWPDAYRINRYVQNGRNCDENAEASLGDFKRFPMWMWRNEVMIEFIEWLRRYNDTKQDSIHKVAFYGMDLYSFYSSMDAVVDYLEKVSPEDAKIAREKYSNFERFQGEPSSYGHATGFGLSPSFEQEVVSTLLDLHLKQELYLKGIGGLIDGDELFYTQQNARIVSKGEEYYRKMYHANESTWNIRDKHMVDSVSNLLQFHSQKFQNLRKEKCVIWAHNSHIGDARETDKGKVRKEWNVGQLIREKFGMEKTYNIGFSTYCGTVTASHSWNKPSNLFTLRNAFLNSYEHIFHEVTENWEHKNYMVITRSNNPSIVINENLNKMMNKPRHERYVGVIYRPETEKGSHYKKSVINKEYDTVIFIDKTEALKPIDITLPWKQQYEKNQEINDLIINKNMKMDNYPEIDFTSNFLLIYSHHKEDDLKNRLFIASDLTDIAIQYLENGYLDIALAKFTKVLNYVEYNYDEYSDKKELIEMRMIALLNRAECYYKLKNWSGVVRDCETALEIDEKNKKAHLLLGKSYDEKGQERLAHKHYSLAANCASNQLKSLPINKKF